MPLFPALQEYTQSFTKEFDSISPERKLSLTQTAKEVNTLLKQKQLAKLTFICTHNSRRSMFGQIWAKTAAYAYGIENIFTYSGGTEATAFNERAVLAVERAGFRIIKKSEVENPLYEIYYGENEMPLQCYSKVYDVAENPQEAFIAIMTCNHADENCPFIPGAYKRIPLTYIDPKVADNTPEESSTYSKRCQQIAIEMFFMMSRINELIKS